MKRPPLFPGVSALAFVVLGLGLAPTPARAQEFAALLAHGPVSHLRGPALLQARGNLTAGDGADIAWADYDGDGRPDLIAGSALGDLVLYRRLADGFARPAVMLAAAMPFARGQSSRSQVSPELADLDGDGLADLVLGAGGEVYLYRRTADGMQAGQALAVGDGQTLGQATRAGHLAPCVVDFDGDGDPDLLLGDGEGRVWWVEHLPGPPLKLAAPHLLAAGGQPLRVGPRARLCAGDWDRDGILDLILGDANGRLAWARGTRQGLDVPQPLLPGQARASPTEPLADLCPRLGDADGDGDPELLLGCRQGFVAVFEATPNGPVWSGYLQAADVPLDVGRYAAPTITDWNDDDLPDVLCGAEDGQLRLYLARADGRFEAGQLVAAAGAPLLADPGDGPGRYSWPRLADISGDGVVDLLLGGASGRIAVYLNQGELRAAGALKIGGAPVTAHGLSTLSLADYDDDGDLDFFVGDRAAPDASPAADTSRPRFLLPPGGVTYYENEAPKGGGLPVLLKGVRLTLYIGRTDRAQDDAALDGAVLGPYYLEPFALRHDTWDFLVGTHAGYYVFPSARSRRYYPVPVLATPRGGVPAPLLPASVYSCTSAALKPGQPGLLCGLGDYGFVCYYPPDQVAEITGGG